MSYDIPFIKDKDVTLNNVEHLLTNDVGKTDNHYIPRELMMKIKESLASQGLHFETFEDSSHLELNFPTYQMTLFDSQIGLSIPYWDSNSTDTISRQVNIIINTLLDNGFTGYDSQTEKLITQKYNLHSDFTASKSIVDAGTPEVLNKRNNNSSNMLYYGITLCILILMFIIWRYFKTK